MAPDQLVEASQAFSFPQPRYGQKHAETEPPTQNRSRGQQLGGRRRETGEASPDHLPHALGQAAQLAPLPQTGAHLQNSTPIRTNPHADLPLFEQRLERLDEVEGLAAGLPGEPSPEALQLGSCFVRDTWLPWTSDRLHLGSRQAPQQSLDVLVPQRREDQAFAGNLPPNDGSHPPSE